VIVNVDQCGASGSIHKHHPVMLKHEKWTGELMFLHCGVCSMSMLKPSFLNLPFGLERAAAMLPFSFISYFQMALLTF